MQLDTSGTEHPLNDDDFQYMRLLPPITVAKKNTPYLPLFHSIPEGQ